jgi:hypothetical protein
MPPSNTLVKSQAPKASTLSVLMCNAIYQQNLGDQSHKKMRGLLSPTQ